METRNSSFVNMLEPMLKIAYNSSSVNQALGRLDARSGKSPFIVALVSRLEHPNALARRMLLAILTSLYEKHRSPKQLVARHKLVPLVRRLSTRDPGVLVQQIASQLLRAFEAHDLV